MSIVDHIAHKSGLRFRAATRPAGYRLRSLGMPEEAFASYAVSEPVRTVGFERVRLSPLATVLKENRDYVAGAYGYPCGFGVFATSDCGDAFCFDTRSCSETSNPTVLIA